VKSLLIRVELEGDNLDKKDKECSMNLYAFKILKHLLEVIGSVRILDCAVQVQLLASKNSRTNQ
jgi:hypothetical protein